MPRISWCSLLTIGGIVSLCNVTWNGQTRTDLRFSPELCSLCQSIFLIWLHQWEDWPVFIRSSKPWLYPGHSALSTISLALRSEPTADITSFPLPGSSEIERGLSEWATLNIVRPRHGTIKTEKCLEETTNPTSKFPKRSRSLGARSSTCEISTRN